MNKEEDKEPYPAPYVRLEGSDMFCSKEDYQKLYEAFEKVLAGTMSETDYLKFRDSIPGTTKPK